MTAAGFPLLRASATPPCPSAKRSRAVKGEPPRPRSTRYSAAFDGPAKRSYTPHNNEPAPPKRWVERSARSIKGSDTPQST
jgi:hypothetical protein